MKRSNAVRTVFLSVVFLLLVHHAGSAQCHTISIGIGSTGHYYQMVDSYQTFTMPSNGLVTGFTFYGVIPGGQSGNITYRVYRMPEDTLLTTATISEVGVGETYYGVTFGYQSVLYFAAGSQFKVRITGPSLTVLNKLYYANNNPYSGGVSSAAGGGPWDLACRVYTSNAPSLDLSSSSISFGTISLGSQGTDSIVVTNPGCYTLTISSVTKSTSQVTVSPTSASIAAGASQTFSISYLPTIIGSTADTIRFISDSPVEDTVRVPVSGSANSSTPSNAGNAVTHNGSTSYAQVASPASIANGSFTLECWAKSTSASPSGWFFGQGTAGTDQGLHIGYISSTAVRYGFWSDDVDFTSVTDAQNWHHWAFTYDAGTNLQTIYRDGISVATHTTTNDYSGTGTFYIGRLFSGGSFDGTLDEVRMWNVARTAQQIQNTLYQPLTGSESGLVGYWRFDESSGTTCVDATGNGRTATLVNSPTRLTSTATLAPMSSVTNAASSVGPYASTLNGSVNAAGLSTNVRFYYGLTTSYTDSIDATGSPLSGTSAQSVAVTLSLPLAPNTTYHYAVRASNTFGTIWGNDQSFTTDDIEPTVQASDITIFTVGPDTVLFAWNAGNGFGNLVLVRADSAVNATPTDLVTYAGSETLGAGTQIGSGNFVVQQNGWRAATIRGLSPSTTYHVAVFEYNGSAGIEDFLQPNPARASFTTPSGELPVEMVGMNAEVRSQRSEVRLSWRTASEVDNAGWEVERRAIANFGLPIADYQKIAFVEGAGTSTSPHAYVFTDDISQSTIRNPQSRYVYRLKQLDRSGSFSYSHEVEIEVGTAPREVTLAQNYPNPFNPTTTISFSVPEDGEVELEVMDVLGRRVAQLFKDTAPAGRLLAATFDASSLPSGIYFARLRSGDRQLLKKMTLLK